MRGLLVGNSTIIAVYSVLIKVFWFGVEVVLRSEAQGTQNIVLSFDYMKQ